MIPTGPRVKNKEAEKNGKRTEEAGGGKARKIGCWGGGFCHYRSSRSLGVAISSVTAANAFPAFVRSFYLFFVYFIFFLGALQVHVRFFLLYW